MTTHDYFASTEGRRAWLHCSMTSTRHGGSYENEYMFVLSFDEAGEKITKIVSGFARRGLMFLRLSSSEIDTDNVVVVCLAWMLVGVQLLSMKLIYFLCCSANV
jgi:GTP-sensing pleiotropic transcriptional regulator CodY